MKKKILYTIKLIAILTILLLLCRVIYIEAYHFIRDDYNFSLISSTIGIFNDIPSLILIIILNIIYITKITTIKSLSGRYLARIGVTTLYALFSSALVTLLHNREIVISIEKEIKESNSADIIFTFLVVLFINILLVIITDIFHFIGRSKSRINIEKEQRDRAQYQYMQLKAQLNPHFLFNSLNFLDYLVLSDKRERASLYIRKLASLYRYLLIQEEQATVALSEEMELITKYIDLLKQRFDSAFEVEIEIDEEVATRHIVPCSLMIVVENAVKHNVVKHDRPLKINIYGQKDYVVVENNLQLRLHHDKIESTKIGLKNLNSRSLTIANRAIITVETESRFIVKIPLI